MKKKLISMFVVMAAFIIPSLAPQPARAAISTETFHITGTIYSAGMKPVPGAPFKLVCTGNEKNGHADANGFYSVTVECEYGSTITVMAWGKHASGGVSKSTWPGDPTDLNLDIYLTIFSVPEYGLISGILAAGAGIGVVVYTHRRYA